MKYEINTLSQSIQISTEYDVISFDIYDTLIFRKEEDYEYREWKICKLMSNYLRSRYSIDTNDILLLRKSTFELSKKITKDELDYDLFIDRVLSFCGIIGVDYNRVKNELIKIEEDYEISISYVNPEALATIKQMIDCGKKLILISDMYLSKKSMERILKELDLLLFFKKVYISSSCNYLTKNTGRLYQYVKNDIKCSRILHIGDNYQSDCINAIGNDFSACYYHNVDNNKRRKMITKEIQAINIGHLLLTRKKPLITTIAEAFSIYIKKIINKAALFKSKKIYILTRDATFLLDPLNEYIKFMNMCIEIKILHIDRISTIFLNLKNASDFANNIYLYDEEKKSTLLDFIEKIQLPSELYDVNILKDFFTVPLRDIVSSKTIETYLETIIKYRRATLLSYLDSQDFFTEDNIMMVDVGYSGTSFNEIGKYIRDNNISTGRIDCFMFASNKYIHRKLLNKYDNVFIHEALILPFDRKNPLVFENYSWLEPLILDSRYGPIKGYDGSGPRRSFDAYHIPVYEKIELIKRINKCMNKKIDENSVRVQLYMNILFPNIKDISLYNNVEHCHNYDNSAFGSVFSCISIKNIRHDYEKLIEGGCWFGGSVTKAHKSFLLKIWLLYRYISR